MLNQAEEEILKRLAREHAPRVVVNPNRGNDETSEHSVQQHINEQFRRAGNIPMTVVAGPTDGPGSTTPFIEAPRDWKFEDKVRKFMDPGEQLLAFIARTGISKQDALTLSEKELEHRVMLSHERNSNEWSPDRDPYIESDPRMLDAMNLTVAVKLKSTGAINRVSPKNAEELLAIGAVVLA